MSVVIRSVPRGLLARQTRRLVMTRGFCTAGKEEEKQSEEGQQKENKSKDVGNPISSNRFSILEYVCDVLGAGRWYGK
ncbi:hypothetical protein FOZ62_019704 [Perkinsus olseni]|uniref:Uncharacterized protein n=1 Tax=Perkinsus olseni TaxID=32597 RepID=A0A7J6RBB0_PEROL|nr:hypothetical protein FOZ62_019704 [Perkinsus olseni]